MVGPSRPQSGSSHRIFPNYESAHRFIRALMMDVDRPALHPGGVPGYVVEQRLGEGGSAEVFKARDIATGRLVALKVFRSLPGSSESRSRAWNELELL